MSSRKNSSPLEENENDENSENSEPKIEKADWYLEVIFSALLGLVIVTIYSVASLSSDSKIHINSYTSGS